MSGDEIAAIDKLIASGDFDNRTEFIRYCVRKVLSAYSGQRIGFDISDLVADRSKIDGRT